MNGFVDKKMKIGLFDSGIGGFSILKQLLKNYPYAEYFYYSDDQNAPYGPKSDEFITERSVEITNELIKQKVDLIVVACNTATAASIDYLRDKYSEMTFVGVEPFLNAYYKMPEGDKRMVVLTTESTGRSERFKRLKEKLDPEGNIEHIALPNLARLIEDFYFLRIDEDSFLSLVEKELKLVEKNKYTHAILGCTHYPLIDQIISKSIGAVSVYPDEYIAHRVSVLLNLKKDTNQFEINFKFFSSSNKLNHEWRVYTDKMCELPFIKYRG